MNEPEEIAGVHVHVQIGSGYTRPGEAPPHPPPRHPPRLRPGGDRGPPRLAGEGDRRLRDLVPGGRPAGRPHGPGHGIAGSSRRHRAGRDPLGRPGERRRADPGPGRPPRGRAGGGEGLADRLHHRQPAARVRGRAGGGRRAAREADLQRHRGGRRQRHPLPGRGGPAGPGHLAPRRRSSPRDPGPHLGGHLRGAAGALPPLAALLAPDARAPVRFRRRGGPCQPLVAPPGGAGPGRRHLPRWRWSRRSWSRAWKAPPTRSGSRASSWA